MAIVTSLLKAVLLAAAVALYYRPLEIAEALNVPPPKGGRQPVHIHSARFGLSVLTYSYALSCASSHFVAILVLIALQTVCLAAAIGDQEVLGGALRGFVDAATEKELFEKCAVVLFGLLLMVILFGGRNSGKDYYRRRLVAFYAKHNPEKISDVGKILKKYEGKEELLFARLHRKYSRVLSHTPAEDAVDELDRNGDEDEDVSPEGAYIEEVEYIQATSSPTSSSTSSYSKSVFSSKTTTTFSSSNGQDEVTHEEHEEEQDEADLPMLQPRVKSPVVKSPVSKSPVGKAPSVPPSPALSQRASGSAVGSAAGSAAGSRASSPPRSPGNDSVRKASEDARRALQERVQQRVAQLQSRSATKKKP